MKISLKKLSEPQLVFGHGAIHVDPRKGLQQGGILSRDPDSFATIQLGLVCLKSDEVKIRKWIQRLHNPMLDTVDNVLRFPPFPGSAAALACRFVVQDANVRTIPDTVADAMLRAKHHHRFDYFLKLYHDKIASLFKDGGPACIIVGVPEELATLRIDNPMLTFQDRRLLEKLRTETTVAQLELFDTTSKEDEDVARQLLPQADELLYRIWHRALKARCLRERGAVPIQVVRHHTFEPDSTKQNDATKAWNISVAMSYKAGHIPWKPLALTPNSCYVGISFHHLKSRGGDVVYASLAQAYSTDAEPYAIRGVSIPKEQRIDRQPYLTADQADEILSQVCERFEIESGCLPQRVVVHKSSKFQEEEILGFRRSLARGIAQIDMVSLRATGLRLVNRGEKEIARGSLIRIEEDRVFLFTSGFVDGWQSYPGPHIPSPLELCFSGSEDVEQCAREILTLTKMNWNNAEGIGRVPITLSFSQQVGSVMTEIDENDTMQPFYRYYM